MPADRLLAAPWGHHDLPQTKVKDLDARAWYMRATGENGWSRSVLLAQIQSSAFERSGLGRQYHLELQDRDFYLDLLFHHLRLCRYVVIEIKRGEFKPEYAGRVNFYCNVVDDQLRHDGDEPTIGLILCQENDRLFAEYTLRGVETPMGVSTYQLTRALPAEPEASLPTIEQIECELTDGDP